MAKHCFFPNGQIVEQDVPCFMDTEASPCCGVGWTCLANGLCYYPPSKQLGRGSCTDYTWNSSDCPQYCTKNEFKGTGGLNYSSHGATVWQCSDHWAAQGGLMCCAITDDYAPRFNGSCCSGSQAINLFSLGSKIGTATSITLSPSTSTTSVSITTSFSSANFSTTSLPNSVLTSDHFTKHSLTIGLAFCASFAGIFLIIACFAIVKTRGKKRKMLKNNQNNGGILFPKDQQEIELPESKYVKPELTESKFPRPELLNSRFDRSELPESRRVRPELPE